MDELDEFNEAPHIVHGDVILSPSLSTDLHRSGDAINDRDLDDDANSLDINGGITVDLLDDDDEDIVLSTDDLLLGGGGVGGGAANFNDQMPSHRRVGGGGVMHINGNAINLNKHNSNNVLT